MTSLEVRSTWVFDAAVAAAVVSAVVMLVMGRWEAAIRFGLMAVVMVGARWGDIPLPFAAGFATFLLIATWASVQHWYRTIPDIDLPIHFFTVGSLGAAAYFLLSGTKLLPDVRDRTESPPSGAVVLWVTVVGVTAAVLWEFYEWTMEQLVPQGILVGYDDTLGDLLAGMLGCAAAGLCVVWWSRRVPSSSRRH